LPALLFPRGALAWLRRAWIEGSLSPLVSAPTTAELIRVLSYPKFRLEAEEIESVLAAYLPYAELAVVERPPATSLPRCRDKADQMFLELAAAAVAESLVSGDREILALSGRTPFLIETPAAFARRFPRTH
jgi:uncharacterized protein